MGLGEIAQIPEKKSLFKTEKKILVLGISLEYFGAGLVCRKLRSEKANCGLKMSLHKHACICSQALPGGSVMQQAMIMIQFHSSTNPRGCAKCLTNGCFV